MIQTEQNGVESELNIFGLQAVGLAGALGVGKKDMAAQCRRVFLGISVEDSYQAQARDNLHQRAAQQEGERKSCERGDIRGTGAFGAIGASDQSI